MGGEVFQKLVVLLKRRLDRFGGGFPQFARRLVLAIVVPFKRGCCNVIRLDVGTCPLMASGVL
jgi:hypothetical protein